MGRFNSKIVYAIKINYATNQINTFEDFFSKKV